VKIQPTLDLENFPYGIAFVPALRARQQQLLLEMGFNHTLRQSEIKNLLPALFKHCFMPVTPGYFEGG